jgi:hypothetical protein
MEAKGWTNRRPTESPWVPGEVGLLCAERVEPVPDMAAAGGRCCGQGEWRQQERGGQAAWRRAAEGFSGRLGSQGVLGS